MGALLHTSRGAARAAGAPRYKTGRPCKNGHTSERYTDKALCVECNNASSRRYRDSNPGIGSENVRRWRENNPEAAKELYANAGRLWRYGITREEFEARLSAQGNACAICRVKFDGASKSTRPHVDHDHTTGAVRGILCHHCNSGIGHLRESQTILASAAAYLRRAAR